MDNKRCITVPPDFFKKSRNDYADWLFAFFREIIQNSIDAGATTITFIIDDLENGGCRIQAIDNGKGMSVEVLEHKFFALRQTTKGDSEGSTGAFGVAKEVIAFAHDNYRVETNGFVAKGVGAEYELDPIDNGFIGVSITVEISDTDSYRARRKLKEWVAMSTVDADIILDGVILPKSTISYAHKMKVDFGSIKFREIEDRSYPESKLIVKMSGMPMFVRSQYTTGGSFEGVLDLNGKSVDQLTSNRDGLKGTLENNLLGILNQLANDRGRLKMNEPITVEYNTRRRGITGGQLRGNVNEIESVTNQHSAYREGADQFAGDLIHNGASEDPDVPLKENRSKTNTELAATINLDPEARRGANKDFARDLSRRMMRREYDSHEKAQNRINRAMSGIENHLLPKNWIVRVGTGIEDAPAQIRKLKQRSFVKMAHVWELTAKYVLMRSKSIGAVADEYGNINVNGLPVKFGFILDDAKAQNVEMENEYHFLINPFLTQDYFTDDYAGIVEMAAHEAAHFLVDGHNESMINAFHDISRDVRMAIKREQDFSGIGTNRLENWTNNLAVKFMQ